MARERFRGEGMAVNRKDFTLLEEGNENDARLLTDPSLSLYCLDLDRREAVFVSLPANTDLESAPFYYEAQANGRTAAKTRVSLRSRAHFDLENARVEPQQ